MVDRAARRTLAGVGGSFNQFWVWLWGLLRRRIGVQGERSWCQGNKTPASPPSACSYLLFSCVVEAKEGRLQFSYLHVLLIKTPST